MRFKNIYAVDCIWDFLCENFQVCPVWLTSETEHVQGNGYHRELLCGSGKWKKGKRK